MRKFLSVLMTLGLFSLACRLSLPASAETATPDPTPVAAISIQIPNATMIYYEISGSTADELRAQMNQQGPLDPLEGVRYDARTDWYISWTWPGYGSSDCDLSKTTVSYDIKVTVPYWKPASTTDPKLIEQWNHYLNNLSTHEQGHVNSVVKNYPRVKEAIQRSTCLTAEQAAQDMLNTFQQANTDYDVQTKHGETQGAIFP
jgi:predicted secreted Zn-dependent protease